MATERGVTFTIKKMETFPLKVELAIPPTKPIMQGVITCHAIVHSKDEFAALAEEQLSDREYFDRVITGIDGMGVLEGDNVRLLSSDEAIDEVKNGKLNMYYLPAVIAAYFEQFGEARRKNSKPSSR